MECYTYLRNVTDLLSDGKTPYERRFGKPFKGPTIPFGSLVEYYPISTKDQSRIHQFGKKVLPGLFLGYALYAVWIWKGELLIADLEELETMDASEIFSKRLSAKEVIFPKGKRIIYFSNRRWTNQNPWRRSGTKDIHLDTGPPNSRRRSRRFSWRTGRVSTPTTSRLTSGCRWSDKWFLVHVRKLHIPPSRWTQSPTLLAKRRIIPCSTEIHWRLQNYSYKFGCWARSRIDDCWNIDGSRDLSDSWTGFTQFILLEEKPPDGYMWSGWETDKKAADIQARSFMARTPDEIGKKCPAEGEAKVATWKTKTR